MYQILCVDDNENFLFGLKANLRTRYQVVTATDEATCISQLEKEQIDLVLLDVSLGEPCSGVEVLKKIKERFPNLVVIMLSAYKDPMLIVEAIRNGAADYLCKPYPHEELVAVIEKNLTTKNVIDKSEAYIELYNREQSKNSDAMIGSSMALHKILERTKKLMGHDATILIEGESGTGKEVLAKQIHAQENNTKRPFIAVNCAAIPETLIESELFGHEKGSFTGATQRRIGKFELANGGDIFLDEINSLKPDLQAKLLRVLQDKSFYRLGGVQPIKISVRVIAAANANLDELTQTGLFRSDLMYRLRVISFKMPPLRDRKEDLPGLIAHFLKKHFAGKKIEFSKNVLQIFNNYNWPGNIRQLENLILSLGIMSSGMPIQVSDLPDWFGLETSSVQKFSKYEQLPKVSYQDMQQSLKSFVRTMEIEYIKTALDEHKGDVRVVAKKLGTSRSKIYWTLQQDKTGVMQ